MLRLKTASLLALLALALPGCPASATYCQSGPKHGTQCHEVHEPDPADTNTNAPPDHAQKQVAPH